MTNDPCWMHAESGFCHWGWLTELDRSLWSLKSFFLHVPRVFGFKMPAGWQLVNHLEHPKVMVVEAYGTQRFFRKGQETLVKKICCHRWCNEQMSSAEEFKISQHQQSSFSCFTKAAMSKNKVQQWHKRAHYIMITSFLFISKVMDNEPFEPTCPVFLKHLMPKHSCTYNIWSYNIAL